MHILFRGFLFFLIAIAGLPAGQAWVRSARVFLIDAYYPPFAPEFEFDAEALARTMAEMNVNTVRIPTMGKYATIPGVRFSTHPQMGKRDVLAETIAACKPRGIRVVPYISTGHKLAWSMVTGPYAEYAQRTRPGGGPARSHMFVGEDHGTVCWNTPYRQAYMDLLERVVRDYDVDGVYFDTWRPAYFWPSPRLCYCDGCRRGFREASGKEIPWRENQQDYTREERQAIGEYHLWQREQLAGIVADVRRLVKRYKDIPLIYNINHARLVADEDPRIIGAMDAFLYERGTSLVERAEGISFARAMGLEIWPYIGVYNNWPRVIPNRIDYQQEIFTTAAFGGAPILAQPYAYVKDAENRRYVSFPFSVLKRHESELSGFESVPYAAVVYADKNPPGYSRAGWWWKADTRSATLGAFATCLREHVQATSLSESMLDDPARLRKYRVVYLAGTPYLSPRRVQNLKQFVDQGGGLLASYGTSLYDAAGRRQQRFGLEELLRVRPLVPRDALAETLQSYQTMTGGPNDLYLQSRPAGRLVPLWYFEPVETLEGASVRDDIVTGDGRRAILPGVVTARHGRGRTVYLASSLESLALSANFSELGELVRTLIEYAAGEPPPYRVQAPPSLVCNLARNGRRLVLHMVNWAGEAAGSAASLPPAENVTVRIPLPPGDGVRRVSSFIEAPFRHKRTADALEISLPRVEAYQAIVIELEPPKSGS
ncbi:MAG: hypothetical protein HY822_15695 [Acidobacteria bacterium]|nr:hypothetical protein [Acidobacteriota bacterium]